MKEEIKVINLKHFYQTSFWYKRKHLKKPLIPFHWFTFLTRFYIFTQDKQFVNLQNCNFRAANDDFDGGEKNRKGLINNIIFLSRFHEAWALCKSAGTNADWAELGKACLVHMEVELAIQVYRMSGNVGMVLSLQSIQVYTRFPD